METRDERRGVPSQSAGSDTVPAADVRLGTMSAVSVLLLVALNLALIGQLMWPREDLGRALVGLALAVAILDLAVALLLVRPWWPGRGEGATKNRAEQRRQERLARRAERDGAG